MQRIASVKFRTFFVLLDKFFFASSWMKIYCYWTSCHVSFIWLPSFESFSARWIWISVHLRRPQGFVCLVYWLPSSIFYWVLFSFYGTPGNRAKLVLNLHSSKRFISKSLPCFCRLFDVQLSSFFRCAVIQYFVGRRKNYPISSVWIRFTGIKIENSRFTEIKTDFSRITHHLACALIFHPLVYLQYYRTDVLTILHDYCMNIKSLFFSLKY